MHVDFSSCKACGACQACHFLVVLVFWIILLKRPREDLLTSESKRALTDMFDLPLGGLDLIMGFCLVL